LIVAMASVSAIAVANAAAPAQDARGVVRRASGVATESNEQIVADFLRFKERAERAQRSIILDLRKELDQKRAEFEEARKRFDEARGRYVEIAGPLAKQGLISPNDPRLPYEFEVRRSWPESGESRPGFLSQRGAGAGAKPLSSEATPK
jgi:hypothetical protein